MRKDRHGERRRHTLVALRSLFAHAKKTKAIFRNPTSHIKVGQQESGVLQPLRPEHLQQATQAAVTPATRVLVALAGVYTARVGAILAIQLDDPDLGNRTAYPRFTRVVSGRESAEAFSCRVVGFAGAAVPFPSRSRSRPHSCPSCARRAR